MKSDILNYIYILIIWQSFLFTAVLFNKKSGNKNSNKIVGIILLLIGIHFIIIFLNSTRLIGVIDFPIFLFGFLYGPLIYVYIRFELKRNVGLNFLDTIHLLPFLFLLFITPFMGIPKTIAFLRLPLFFVYCLFGFHEIIKFKKSICKTKFQQKNHLKIKLLIALLFLTIYNSFLSIILDIFYKEGYLPEGKYSLPLLLLLGVLVVVNFIAYLGLKASHVFYQTLDTNTGNSISNNNSRSLYNIESMKLLSFKLEEYIIENAVYKNAELDLSSLAEALEVHPKMLSQTMNKVIGSNFSDYINSLRIEDSKNILKTCMDNEVTIKEIMYDVGFSSRSVFNTLFKKKTGLTPTQYRNEYS